ncbi:MAG: hypothetical protein BWK78_08755 [Thiotrichaceae bacterium IS1]|nr:MAG: hypothetical protein BWK78_08755 [Thiotrichaceae bacterium IS1]
MAISEELRKRVAQLEAEQQRQEKDVSDLTKIRQETSTSEKAPKNKEGFFVKLVFGDNAPVSEWSDETHGWRTAGLGTRYPNQQIAAELKEKWPNYPLQIGSAKKG